MASIRVDSRRSGTTRTIVQDELRAFAAADGAIDWDEVLEVADASCAGDPGRVVDMDGPWMVAPP